MGYTKKLLEEQEENEAHIYRLDLRAKSLATIPWATDEHNFYYRIKQLIDIVSAEDNLAICRPLNAAATELLSIAIQTWDGWQTEDELADEAEQHKIDVAQEEAKYERGEITYLVPK